MLRAAKVLGTILLSVGLSQRGNTHVISGTVTDMLGGPDASALVTAVPIGNAAGDVTWSKVDDKGNFRLAVKDGRYIVRAKDEEHGYPDPTFLLSADAGAEFPDISVEGADLAGVRVVLGQQGGILIGQIVDSHNNRPVGGGRIIVRATQAPTQFVELTASKDGLFQFTLPHKPVRITSTADGYRTARYADGAELILSNGERREIVIPLEPK